MALKSGLRWFSLAALAIMFLTGTLGVALAFPAPLFSYHAERGRLSLYSDRPFNEAIAQKILANIDARISTSPFDHGEHQSIFVANSDWRQRLLMNVAYGAGGVNFYPVTRNVFLRNSEIDADRLVGPSGHPVALPRSFTYFAAHEIGHSLTGEFLGATHLWNWSLPQWIREGYADYVGFGGHVDVRSLYAQYRVRDPVMDYAKSGQYARFRLLVAYMIQNEHWSAQRLLLSDMPQSAAENLLATGMNRRLIGGSCRNSRTINRTLAVRHSRATLTIDFTKRQRTAPAHSA